MEAQSPHKIGSGANLQTSSAAGGVDAIAQTGWESNAAASEARGDRDGIQRLDDGAMVRRAGASGREGARQCERVGNKAMQIRQHNGARTKPSEFKSAWTAAPLLSDEQEAQLFRRWHDQQDEEALSKLAMSHMRMVAKIAGKFRRYGLSFDDMMQEGAVGLVQAAARFDPTYGVRFGSYAKQWVQASIYSYVVRNSSIVRPGVTSKHISLFFRMARLKGKAGFDPRLTEQERAELAKETGARIEVVTALEARIDGADVPLNARISSHSNSEVQDFLADSGPTPEDIVSDAQEASALSHSLADAMRKLNDRERLVIEQRYLGDDGVTLETVGRQLGVSKERVRQIQKEAVKKLGGALRSHVAA